MSFKQKMGKVGKSIKGFFVPMDGKPRGARTLLAKDGTHTVISSLICIAVGLLIGFLILLCLNPAFIFDQGFDSIITGGMNSGDKNQDINIFGKILMSAAPLTLCALSILFAYKAGLFNIGTAGQYCIGMMVSLYAAHAWNLHWIVCILLAVVAAAIWAALVGVLKALCNVNEVISGIMLNWIAVYLTNIVINSKGSANWIAMDGDKGTIPVTGSSVIPDWGLTEAFKGSDGGTYVTFAIFLAVIMAVVIWFILKKTTFGYQIRATGLSKDAARYAGMKTKTNIIYTLMISGALAGLGAALCYLSNLDKYMPLTSVPAMGFNGIAVAFLGGLHPIGAVLAGLFVSFVTEGGGNLNPDAYLGGTGVANLVISVIIYLCAFVLFIKQILKKRKLFREPEEKKKTFMDDGTQSKGGGKQEPVPAEEVAPQMSGAVAESEGGQNQ